MDRPRERGRSDVDDLPAEPQRVGGRRRAVEPCNADPHGRRHGVREDGRGHPVLERQVDPVALDRACRRGPDQPGERRRPHGGSAEHDKGGCRPAESPEALRQGEGDDVPDPLDGGQRERGVLERSRVRATGAVPHAQVAAGRQAVVQRHGHDETSVPHVIRPQQPRPARGAGDDEGLDAEVARQRTTRVPRARAGPPGVVADRAVSRPRNQGWDRRADPLESHQAPAPARRAAPAPATSRERRRTTRRRSETRAAGSGGSGTPRSSTSTASATSRSRAHSAGGRPCAFAGGVVRGGQTDVQRCRGSTHGLDRRPQ